MTVCQKGRLGNVAVLGLGRTGESVARYLAGQMPARVEAVTLYGGAASEPGEKTRALEALGVRVVCGTDAVDGRYDLAVASPGIPDTSDFFLSARAHAAEVIGEPELAWRESPERWVAITGTNGKTTTTSLATHLLRVSGLAAESVGNIGTPPTEALASRGDATWFVAELSSFQLATTRLFRPRVAVLLNVTPDHLEWHHTMEAYAAAKERVFANLDEGDLAVVSIDDDWCRAAAERLEGRGYALAAGEGLATIEHAALETGRDRVDPHELAKKEHKLKKRELGCHLNGHVLRRGAAKAVPQSDDRALGKGDARYVDLEEALRALRPLAADGDVDWFRELRETSYQRGDLLAGGYLLRNLCALAPAALETSPHRRGPEDLECRCM